MITGAKMASKIAGKAKGAVKAMTGYPGIFNHLAAEHTEVSAMMRMVASSVEGSSTREELFPEIRKDLLAHAHGEEEEFYPKLRQFPELEPLVARSLEEHKQIETYLEELSSGDKGTEGWRQRFEQMMNLVEGHVDLEEKQVFPRAKDLISTQQAEDILKQYESIEEREKAAVT
jgi:hemerythrin superfamily protein